MDSTEKNDATVQPTIANPDRIEDEATFLTHEESAHRVPALPYQKIKSRVSASGLSVEDADDLKDDRISNGKHTQ